MSQKSFQSKYLGMCKNPLISTAKEGEITQVYLVSRGTSVPMIVTTADSEAKKHGSDGMFAVCNRKCGGKMKAALAKEVDTFKVDTDADHLK
ncbi:MAG TPA: hypothetical protein VK072_07520 [Candidatus Avamphibacillus sp.]|nr:hypothetical protein [Candidatus Avamphibacillus sp.]